MTPLERAEKFNATSGLHATVDDDGRLAVYGDYEPNVTAWTWTEFFDGGRFRQVKLELRSLDDLTLAPLAKALEIVNLNLNGNHLITGRLLECLPETIGLQTLDVTGTSIGNDDMRQFVRFPMLTTVWGSKNQFSSPYMMLAKGMRPTLEFQLIY
jgi:hypothetical protein